MKTTTLVVAVLLLGAGPGGAAEPLVEVDWASGTPPAEAAVVETDRGWSAVRFVWEGEGPKVFALQRIERPGITANQYAVSGEVRYWDVQSGSYLEMWNHLPGGGAFFSRTLALSGPMASLGGTSDWRSFVLPAFLQDHPERPTMLELNLVLTGPGAVEVGPLTLTELDPGESPATLAGGADRAAGGWWEARTAGVVGGLGGAAAGVLTAVLAILVALGRARLAVTVLAVLLLLGGLGSLAAGVLAVVLRQPYAVYYPLLLVGGATSLFMVAILFAAPHRYRRLELRRMRAIDAS